MTIEELIALHFRRRSDEKSKSREDPGLPIEPEWAMQLCLSLSNQQRLHLDEPTLVALSDMLEEDRRGHGEGRFYRDYKKFKSFAWFKARKSPDLERSLVCTIIAFQLVNNDKSLNSFSIARNRYACNTIRHLGDILIKRAIKLSAEQALTMLESSVGPSYRAPEPRFEFFWLKPTIETLHEHRADVILNEDDVTLLTALQKQLASLGYGGETRAWANLLDEVLAGDEEPVIGDLLWKGEAWAEAINQAIDAAGETRSGMQKLLRHAATANTYVAKQSKPWIAEGEKLIAAMGKQSASECTAAWLATFAASERKSLAEFQAQYGRRFGDPRAANSAKFASNTATLAGVATLARLCADAKVLAALCDVVERVATCKHAVRTLSAPVASAAIRSIEACDHPGVGAALSRLALRLRWPKLRKAVEKSFEAYLKRTGQNRDDLEETSVPDFGLINGAAEVKIGDASARIVIAKSPRPRVMWQVPGKEPTHITPRALKQAHPLEVKAVVETVDEIEKMLAAQRTRIDLLFRRETTWPYADWKARYLDHGLVGALARRLIWLIDDRAVLFHDGALADVEGHSVEVAENAQVRLWHPIGRTQQEIVAWRRRLETLDVTQPIKQAYREIYILTDAERQTATYSNRFAAHIIRNHATLAISQVRKWKMGMYGGASAPSVQLPHFGLRAEWWAEAAGNDHDRMGFPLYLVSDQLRFYRADDAEPLPLVDVPPLALTEVMRDVDLFVSIASVGADAEWHDRGPAEGQYHEYWRRFSFGELAEMGKTRRAVLERLVPRLKIASRCTLSDKFLVVRGDLRTYKIHLGSGNILMEPNDQYLCIVPERALPGTGADGSGLYLPFEGDSVLSIIISKAMLLAGDKAITDTTITRQIGSH